MSCWFDWPESDAEPFVRVRDAIDIEQHVADLESEVAAFDDGRCEI